MDICRIIEGITIHRPDWGNVLKLGPAVGLLVLHVLLGTYVRQPDYELSFKV